MAGLLRRPETKLTRESGYHHKKNRQEGGEMGEVPAGEGEENLPFPTLIIFFFCTTN